MKIVNKNGFWERWAVVFIFLYTVWSIFVLVNQEKFVFQPQENLEGTPVPGTLDLERVSIETQGGKVLEGYYLTSPKETAETILFFHEGIGNVTYQIGQLYLANKLERNMLVFDYQGFGNSEGKTRSQKSLLADGNAAWEFLIEEKKVAPENIILWGRDMGAAVAIFIAQEKSIKALIIESVAISFWDRIPQNIARSLPPFFFRYQFSILPKIVKIKAPILLFHSTEDEKVAFEQAQKIVSVGNGNILLQELTGDHTRGFSKDMEAYFRKVKEFLND